MWELDYKESWTPKNWCLWTVVLQKILRVPWTSRRSKQSTLKEISPKCSLEGLMLKLKHQYFGHLMQSSDSFEKTSMLGMIEAGGEEDDRGWDGWMASLTWWTWVWVISGSYWWTGRPDMLSLGVTNSWTRLRGWIDDSLRKHPHRYNVLSMIFQVIFLWWVGQSS